MSSYNGVNCIWLHQARNFTTSRSNKPRGTWTQSGQDGRLNRMKRWGILAGKSSSFALSPGGDINIDGTRYCFPSLSEGKGHNRQNFSIISIRISLVLSLSMRGGHTTCISCSSRTPLSWSFFHNSLYCGLSDLRSWRLTVITFLNSSINHWGSKITKSFNLSVSWKFIKILWSCRKINEVTNCCSSSIPQFVLAILLASARKINGSSFFLSSSSKSSHLIGMVCCMCGSCFAILRKLFNSWTSSHSSALPDLVLSTTKCLLDKCLLYGFASREPYTLPAFSSADSPTLSAWVHTKITGGSFSGKFSGLVDSEFPVVWLSKAATEDSQQRR